MTGADALAFAAYRRRLFEAIGEALRRDGHCKPYEGTVEIRYPTYFADKDGGGKMALVLHCYILGPSRHYEWTGRTVAEVVAEADADLTQWIAEMREDDMPTTRRRRSGSSRSCCGSSSPGLVVGLAVRRDDGETWRECVARIASGWGLEAECLAEFDANPNRETDPAQAAWNALYEWGCLAVSNE